ncbi:COG4948 L-alanine-DL-glutamate epimerase and related enzymes of enolase superfamily [Rhabdaerophilaceae bacterium]
MSMLKLDVAVEHFPITGTFTISRGSRTEAIVVTATISDGVLRGRGECVPYARYGETVERVAETLRAFSAHLHADLDRQQLRQLLPAGAARNALDCALIDLEAKRAGKPAHELLGCAAPGEHVTCYTLSLGTPESMRAAAQAANHRALLKVKLGGEGDVERIAAVRAGAPKARLVVDANEAWRVETLASNLSACLAAGVELIEQPLPAGQDSALEAISSPITICADESIHDSQSLSHLPPWYRAINIKLDKTGGLTDALELRAAAQAKGLAIMVGCMVGTSLAMAPALLVAHGAAFVDLDGPLLLARDREPALIYRDSLVMPSGPTLWG